ncbi:MAG TPA: cytochrome P450 [Acidimicrobiia bacterium]|nr:cytochrome P450 [Acidimicrobiia bacterium]
MEDRATNTRATIEGFDPFTTFQSPKHRADPHPLYHRLRTETPVLFVPEWDEYVLTRHADCEAVLRDTRFSSNPAHRRLQLPLDEQDVRTQLSGTNANVLLFIDPPDHTRIRRLVSKAFTPRRVEEMRAHIQALVDALLDDAQEKGEIDVVLDLGYQVPVTVICEMLGVPKEDRHLFHEWSAAATRLLDGFIPQDEMMKALGGAMSIIAYLGDVIDARRKAPGDDLLSAMIAAEEEGEVLSEEELRSTTLLLFVAGHETTMNLIGNGMYALLRHPDQWQRLRDDLDLAPLAVEELLRYDGPVHVTGRMATEDIEMDGFSVEKGQTVIALLAAANRDPAEFADPDGLDIGRTPNHHLTFSHGIHYCLGAALARVEGQVAIASLAKRFSRVEQITQDVRYRDHFVLRGLEELRIAVSV